MGDPTRIWTWSMYIFVLLFFALPGIGSSDVPNGAGKGLERPANQHVFEQSTDFMALEPKHSTALKEKSDTLSAIIEAIDVMQEQYFEIWEGAWVTAIDWTSAVLGSYISATLSTLSMSEDYMTNSDSAIMTASLHENLVNRYFSLLTSYYFGQDDFALRGQAFDDMLWVVLGWIDTIKFINLHSARFKRKQLSATSKLPWHGEQWIPGFAHRARIFWDLASKGWDERDCDGGMIWSPYLTPYKNAITNELYITASISMYLYFPGDDNASPFVFADGSKVEAGFPVKPQDPKYLKAAIQGYKWLMSSNMTDDKGLFVDGFHIHGYDERKRKNETFFPLKCDERNDMVYTYNQGVLLSGQRGLWEATGARSYLEDGHILIQSVIHATGYDIVEDKPYPEPDLFQSRLGQWHGIGRSGILEDACDAYGYCNQDGQTFKGIFFHHLASFCSPLPPHFIQPGETFDVREFHKLQLWHDAGCDTYAGWIKHNAEAAMRTKNEDGKFGMWWGAPTGRHPILDDIDMKLPENAIDYRNKGVPNNTRWRDSVTPVLEESTILKEDVEQVEPRAQRKQDANDRGRGRTVETQGGGLSVLRAAWEIVDLKTKIVKA